MSGADDKTPMLDERDDDDVELPVTTPRDPRDSPASAARSRRNSKSLLLAAITFILFACALVFLTVGLIVPIFHSLNVLEQRRQQQQQLANATSTALPPPADHHHHSSTD